MNDTLRMILIGFTVTTVVINYVKADVIKVSNLYVETEKTVNTNRGYYLPPDSTPTNNINLGLDISDRFNMIYLNSKISTTTDESQFRYGALDAELGFNFQAGIQLYYRHYSGHMLDASADTRFPEKNVIGIRFNLLNSDER